MILLGLLSDHRVRRSLSPAMHTRILAQEGIKGVYLPFEVAPEKVGQAVEGLRALGMRGANVTVPYKEAVVPFLDRLEAEAGRVGAVNTILHRDGQLIGYNTDLGGFLEALAAAGLEPAGAGALVLGLGGAAKAVAAALAGAGARVTLAGRKEAAGLKLAEELGVRFEPLAGLARGGTGAPLRAELVVNATTVSSPAESPPLAGLVRGLEIRGCRLVMDLNYGRPENLWSGLAGRLGARFADGETMLAAQGRLSFRIWTGVEVGLERFQRALHEAAPPE